MSSVTSVEISTGPPPPGEGLPRRRSDYAGGIISSALPDEPEVDSIYLAFRRSAEKFSKNRCLGSRKSKGDGTFGDYFYESYAEVFHKVRCIGSGLQKLGITPRSTVGIYSVNRPEWTTSLLAIWSHSLVCVPLYDSLGPGATAFVTRDAEISLIFCAGEKVANLASAASEMPSLKTIIMFDEVNDDILSRFRTDSVRLLTFSELIEIGSAPLLDELPPSASDLAYIMYTSGTTGRPRGVLMRHRNVMAGCAGIDATGINCSPSDTYFSYLPLAHSFESVCHLIALIRGVSIAFTSGDIKKLVDDLQAAKPTIMIGVPRVFSRIYERVWSQVGALPAIKRGVFKLAYQMQQGALHSGFRLKPLDNAVFSTITRLLGGNLRFVASGGAPLPPYLVDFLRIVLNCKVLVGYGLTENFASATLSSYDYQGNTSVGFPSPSTEIKLVDVPDMLYSVRDKPCPRGEIWLRGAAVFEGYHRLPDETKDAKEGDWLKTGDVGQWNADGTLSIIDRKKNIFKLSQGEYIAAEALEAVYAKSPLIAQIWVYGNSFASSLVAVVVPNLDTLTKALRTAGRPVSHHLASDQHANQVVVDELKRVAKAHQLKGYEVVKGVLLETVINQDGLAWTIDNDVMTVTAKLKRAVLKSMYQQQIGDLYKKLGEDVPMD